MRALAIFLIFSVQSAWALEPVNSGFFGRVAIRGYDTVAYFTEGKAVKGVKAHTYQWNGAKWRFSSQQNRDLFSADPDRYAPQYGGYCAYAVSQGTTAGIDPAQFSVVNGRLYLNYNDKIQRKWLQRRDEFVLAADKYWPQLIE